MDASERETAEILADPVLMAAIRAGEAAVARGDVVEEAEFLAALAADRRPPGQPGV